METETFTVPTTIDFNETDLVRPKMAYRETGKEFIYKGVITGGKQAVNKKNGAPQLELTLRAVTPTNDPVGPEVRYWVTIPVTNPNHPGRKMSDEDFDDAMKDGRDVVQAIAGTDTLPVAPRRREGTTDYYDPSTGNSLSKLETSDAFKNINRAMLKKLTEWYRNSAEVVGAQVFFGTYRSQSGYVNVSYLRHDDGGKSVITENFTEAL